MGGFGSGRRSSKSCTDDMRALDVRRLHRDGFLRPGMRFGWQWTQRGEEVASINVAVDTDLVVLSYRQRQRGGQWQDMSYPVWLERTPCHFGGLRVWWRCPAVGCGRRVAILHGGAMFACRRCHQLAYRCQRETDDDRAARRADTIRRRLGWEPGILNGGGLKPKGMHWRTFERLQAMHDDHVNRSLIGIAQRFKLLGVPCDVGELL
jgi:hypothetical protein